MIYEIIAIDVGGKNYKIIKEKKALLNVTATTGARSAIHCATKCASDDECTHANFQNAQCEFLKHESLGTDIHFEEDAGYKYMCK